MCGIVGYIGSKPASPVLISGLKRLEYRGYDSAGLATLENDEYSIVKCKGRVGDLEEKLSHNQTPGRLGIGHTRWATHGEPNEINAHPHVSSDGRIILVHNGIIENYLSIKTELINKGYTFNSETDTEVLANLISMVLKEQDNLFEAVQSALQLVEGAYAIAVIDIQDEDSLIVAKRSSPIVIGIGDNEFIIGSDATPIVEHTQKVIYINDDEVAELKRDGSYNIASLLGQEVTSSLEQLEVSISKIEKSGFDHYMQKEIHEQPSVVTETMRGRLNTDRTTVLLGGIIDYEQRMLRAPKITFVGCGTSWRAALVGKFLIEELAHIPVEVEYASEFRYREAPLTEQDVVIAISQSGETADTLAAIELAKNHKALTVGIVNVVGSSIARATDCGIYTHAGPEISVASTKAFTAQVTALTLLALRLAQQLGTIAQSELQVIYQQFAELPKWVEEALKSEPDVIKLVEEINDPNVVIFLGRNNCYPVALEGALKLKELAYVPSEGQPAGEMKHGPIALITEGTPVIGVVPSNSELRNKMYSALQEARTRGAYVAAISSEDSSSHSNSADVLLKIPKVPRMFEPIVSVIPMQLLAYHYALKLNRDVDKPRNLAKSVTVE